MADHNAVIGVYNSHTEAEASIKELQRSGFDMKKLSIVGKDYHTEEHVVGYYITGERMKVWGGNLTCCDDTEPRSANSVKQGRSKCN